MDLIPMKKIVYILIRSSWGQGRDGGIGRGGDSGGIRGHVRDGFFVGGSIQGRSRDGGGGVDKGHGRVFEHNQGLRPTPDDVAAASISFNNEASIVRTIYNILLIQNSLSTHSILLYYVQISFSIFIYRNLWV